MPTMAAPLSGCKRPLEQLTTLAPHDPDAAEDTAASHSAAADAGALVPFVPPPPPVVILNAAPLRAVAPTLPPEVRAEPPWLRRRLLPHLKLRMDLPVQFVAEKTVTATDLDRQQNRFRLPSEGVLRNLLPVLSDVERVAANLLATDAPRPPRLPALPPAAVPGAGGSGESVVVRKKRKGKRHGGLPVLVVGIGTGVRELQLSTWDSSRGTVIKGEGYLGFINESGLQAGDVVQIWAFKETKFRLWGVNVCHDSLLYVLIAKKG